MIPSQLELIMGFGLMFGFALVLSYIYDRIGKTFFGFLCMFNVFIVWVDYLPLWTLVIDILVFLLIIIADKIGVKRHS